MKISGADIARLVKFGIVGASGVIVNQTVLVFATKYLNIDYKISSLAAIETAVISNFLLNYNWTWKDRKKETAKDAAVALLKFNATSFFTAFCLNWTILVFLTEVAGVKYYWSNLAGIFAAAGFNFLASNFWVFRKN